MMYLLKGSQRGVNLLWRAWFYVLPQKLDGNCQTLTAHQLAEKRVILMPLLTWSARG